MVFALGVSLASLPVRNLGPSVGRALMRLVPGLAIGVGVAAAFGLEGAERGVLIIQSAMPSAVHSVAWCGWVPAGARSFQKV